MGKYVAKILASKGANVVIASRNIGKLESALQEIKVHIRRRDSSVGFQLTGHSNLHSTRPHRGSNASAWICQSLAKLHDSLQRQSYSIMAQRQISCGALLARRIQDSSSTRLLKCNGNR